MPLRNATTGEQRHCERCGAPISDGQALCLSCRQTESHFSEQETRSLHPAASEKSAAPARPREIGGYSLLRELGSGGMGTVFEALDLKMNRRVALKVLSRHLSESSKAADRFAREAWIAGRLNHPNLVKVFERGESEDVAYYSMELVNGGSLHDVVANMKRFGKDDSWELSFGTREYLVWAISQVVCAARGLDHAHRQGVIHRDIKPGNILLNRDPFMLKIADFGLAVDTAATRWTTAGHVLGTVAYMPPEQIRGRHDLIDGRTDVYSLAVTLYEMLTLELPFVGDTHQLYMNAVLTSQARPPSKLNQRVGRDLEIVLMKSIEKTPGDRYASASAFADDLENVLHFRSIAARPPAAWTKIAKWARRRPLHAVLVGVLAVGVPAVGLLSYRAVQHQRLVEQVELDDLRKRVLKFNHAEQFGQALDPLMKILALHPDDGDALKTRSLAEFRLAQTESDPARRTELQRLALGDASHLVLLVPRVSWPYRLQALVLRNMERPAEADEAERLATQYREDPPAVLELEIDGIAALQAGDNARAVRAFTEIIDRQPDATGARLWRATAYERIGEMEKAKTDYEVAVALMPADPVAFHNLGRLLTLTGDPEAGERRLRKALEIDPENARAYEFLIHNLLEQGRKKAASGDAKAAAEKFGAAELAATEALRLDPDLPYAHLDLGATFIERSRLSDPTDTGLIQRARAEYQMAISLCEEGKEGSEKEEILRKALGNQCDALIQLRDLPEALATCRKIAEIDAPNPVNHYNLAGVYALLGSKEKALRSLEEDFARGDRDYATLASDRWFDSLHSDPRFGALLEKMKKVVPH